MPILKNNSPGNFQFEPRIGFLHFHNFLLSVFSPPLTTDRLSFGVEHYFLAIAVTKNTCHKKHNQHSYLTLSSLHILSITGFSKLHCPKMSVPLKPSFKNQVILNRIHPEVATFRAFMKDENNAKTLRCILHAYVKATGTESPLFSDRQRETITALVVELHTSLRLTARLYRIFPDIAGEQASGEAADEDGLSVHRDHAENYFARLKALWSNLQKMISQKRIIDRMGDECQDVEENNSCRWWKEVATYFMAIDYDEVESNLSELKVWNREIKAWIRSPFFTWSQRYASVRLVSHR